jgi:hypothetical protein
MNVADQVVSSGKSSGVYLRANVSKLGNRTGCTELASSWAPQVFRPSVKSIFAIKFRALCSTLVIIHSTVRRCSSLARTTESVAEWLMI